MTAPTFDSAGPGTAAEVWGHRLDPENRIALCLDGVRRIVVVGAHPDDETLGAGGLVAAATARGMAVDLVCATDGRASHPDSPTHTPEDLAGRRAGEWAAAADALGVLDDHRHWLALPDGDASSYVDRVTTTLVDLIGDGRGVVVVAPWREDAHPDHEAMGRAAAAAARRTDAELWEYPVWFWHWARPDDLRVRDLHPFRVTPENLETKRAAVAAHASQVAPLSGLAGDEAMLTPDVLAHFSGAHEWFVVTAGARCPDPALDRLHSRQADPWGVDTRWYERRKLDLVLAVLPLPRFRRALEVGCSTGALTAALAARADRVVAVDSSAAAVRAATRRLGAEPDVDVLEMTVPGAWPDGAFDLVVVSEVGYFLSPAALEGLVRRVSSSLTRDGAVVLCHWRHPVEGWVLDADQVHAAFEGEGIPPLQATYRDRDVEIRVHAHEWPAYDR